MFNTFKAPALKSLTLNDYGINWTRCTIPSGLTRLTIEYDKAFSSNFSPSIPFIMAAAISELPLKYLSLCYNPPHNFPPADGVQYVTMPHLTELDIGSSRDVAMYFLDHIITPSDAVIKLTLNPHCTRETLTGLVAPLQAKLTQPVDHLFFYVNDVCLTMKKTTMPCGDSSISIYTSTKTTP